MKKSECFRCQWHAKFESGEGRELCHLGGVGYYDVQKATRIIRSRRRPPMRVSVRMLRERARILKTAVYEPHLAHVNVRKFGIIGFIIEDGEQRWFTLEGSHREARCLQERRQFQVYALTLEETAEVFVGKRRPRGTVFTKEVTT